MLDISDCGAVRFIIRPLVRPLRPARDSNHSDSRLNRTRSVSVWPNRSKPRPRAALPARATWMHPTVPCMNWTPLLAR